MKSQTNKLFPYTSEDLVKQFYSISYIIHNLANRDILRIDFLNEISKLLLIFSKCDSIELWLEENHNYTHCEMSKKTKHAFHYDLISSTKNDKGELITMENENSILDYLRRSIINRNFDPSISFFTKYGSFWINDTSKSLEIILTENEKQYYDKCYIDDKNNSLALIPIIVGDRDVGLLQLISSKQNILKKNVIELFESIAQVIGSALVTQRTQAALRERVKELACLYDIAQVVERTGTLNEILQSIVKLLPPAWQYPEITVGRIVLDGQVFSTSDFIKGWQKQTADIIVKNIQRGRIEVFYTQIKPEFDEGPFLREERNLINAIAKQISLILEKKETEDEKFAVQEQLRHADRLATIGQLAAGVAHELNEPLGNILGFSQLIRKCSGLPESAKDDTDKIIDATLYARDVIKKLLVFARDVPPKYEKVNLTKVINEGLFIFDARCAKAGIELIRNLSPEIPEFFGERSQLNQVLINLVVNSMQAMPNGGKLTIETHADDEYIFLVVTDTGIGMNEDVKKKIFLPFFTTKDINEGTGLGMAVVHGIITSHKGIIKVKSEVGSGTRIEIRLPIITV